MKKNALFIIMLAVMFSFAFTAEKGALSFGVSSAVAGNDDGKSKDDKDNSKDDNGNSKDDKGNSKDDNGNNKDDNGNNKDDNGKSKDDNGNNDDSNKVTICHVPPGNPSNKQTLSVSQSAVNAHMAHGDSMGACVVTVCHFTTSMNSSSNSSNNESENKNEDKNENKNSNKNDDRNGNQSDDSVSVTASTLEISESDLGAYLAQGDTQGACSPCACPSVTGVVTASNSTCTCSNGAPGVLPGVIPSSGSSTVVPSSVREVFGN